MQPRTAIALSGGVDSLVAAYLLKKQGLDIVALHFLTGYEQGSLPGTTPPDIEQYRRSLSPLCRQLDIPLYIIDLSAEFKSCVVDYFTASYLKGLTPNPCLVCNPMIKFDLLLNKATQWDVARMATGHYARIEPDGAGRLRLMRGVDHLKDQSYFLARLTQQQLASAVLPLGGLTKTQTRRIARDRNLKPVVSEESQDICFIKEDSYIQFLKDNTSIGDVPGPIADLSGRVIGQHQGLHRFTIGQRRGINCPSSEPYYVVRLDPEHNRLIVGRKDDLAAPSCQVVDINWIAAAPTTPISVKVQIRYRHKAVAATVHPLTDTSATVVFDTAESAVSPGQGAVFYQNDIVLGGGWIQ